jgi:hypothetical protein
VGVKYSGLPMGQAKRLKELKNVKAQLKRLLADAGLNKSILREVVDDKF